MRTQAPTVARYIATLALGASFAVGCGDSSSPSEDGGAGEGSGGDAATGGSASGGTNGLGGTSPSGGANPSGGEGGTSTGGDSSGGTPATGGASSGGSAGSGGGLGGSPSTGCNAARVPASGRFTLDVSGTEREYILNLPDTYDAMNPRAYPLVILLHGRAYSAQTVADGGPPGMTGPYFGLEEASAGNAILVAAQALSTSWTNQDGRDVAYLDAMIARFGTELCIDTSRIFAAGFSMGAIMTLTAGCEAENPFRAIAPMSASLPAACSNGPPRAYFGSHGTNDTTFTLAQGEAVRDSFVEKNGCDTTTTPGTRTGCVNYQGCSAGTAVSWCTFTGVHEPPPFAGAAMWEFFSQF
ncbi:MAG TPA: Ricin and poly(3-hydroxybutyrate) depolymerase fusion [Polyangiaceae bacterium]